MLQVVIFFKIWRKGLERHVLNAVMAMLNIFFPLHIFFPLDLSVTNVCGHGQKIKQPIACGLEGSMQLELVSDCFTVYWI